LNIHDDLGFTQLLGQALVLPAEFLHFLFLRIPFGLGTALVRSQALENAGLPLATPGDQVRGVKTFAALQGPDGAGLSGGGVCLGQDAQFVLGGEGSTLGANDNLRVRPRQGGRLGRDGLARRCTSGGLAPLGLPTFRGGQYRGGSRKDSMVLHINSCSRPAQ
jgi:hypothetical protein